MEEKNVGRAVFYCLKRKTQKEKKKPQKQTKNQEKKCKEKPREF